MEGALHVPAQPRHRRHQLARRTGHSPGRRHPQGVRGQSLLARRGHPADTRFGHPHRLPTPAQSPRGDRGAASLTFAHRRTRTATPSAVAQAPACGNLLPSGVMNTVPWNGCAGADDALASTSTAHGAALRKTSSCPPASELRLVLVLMARHQPYRSELRLCRSRGYQPSLARPTNPLSVPARIELSRRRASTPSSRYRASRSSIVRP